ncbi:MAG TPA: apolipoprotein N-acyltransferase [Pseudolysinimonas sp.]|nr:apolipoprotein N-acyltransferase [Pseudolysinimonas sp.]
MTRRLSLPVDAPGPTFVLPTIPALLTAAIAGPILDAAFPGLAWWPLAFPAIALVLLAARGRRAGGGFAVGVVFGAAFFFPHIEWAVEFLDVVPWIALAGLMALWCGLGTMLITHAYRWLGERWHSPVARLVAIPAVVAGLWTAREGVSAVWPYGGFSWGRLGFSQSDSPLSPLFAWIGVSGVTFTMVVLVAVAVQAVEEPRLRRLPRAIVVAGIAFAMVAVPAWSSLPGVTGHETLRVGAVQGDTKAGYFDPPERVGDNLERQVKMTTPLYNDKVDVVVWPEGASDLDPLLDPYAAQRFDDVSLLADAPLVAGAITTRTVGTKSGAPVSEYFNTSILWHAGDGEVDYYDKKHPVPFGEYVPDRAFWRMFAPNLIDMIGRDYTPGTTDSVLDVGSAKTDGRPVLAGIAICFDIVDDSLLRSMSDEGAQIIFAQTNNADFGRTDESVQQLAIARIRAIETGRSVVNISTVGTSAIIYPDGSMHHRLPTYTPGVMVDNVPLETTKTPATVGGRQLELLLAGGALGLLVGAGLTRIRPRTA